MDTFSTVLVFLIIFSALIQVIYMISPRRLKNIMEHYDYDPVLGKRATLFNFQLSQIIAMTFTFLTLLFGGQAHFYTSDKRFYETLETQEQRQFRHRQVWAYQSYQYQSLIIAAIWFGIKILMSISRSKKEVKE
jgi:hypothetical protein